MREISAHQILVEVLEGWLMRKAGAALVREGGLTGECRLMQVPSAEACRAGRPKSLPSRRGRSHCEKHSRTTPSGY